jgi:hemolysin activation/secretion protein
MQAKFVENLRWDGTEDIFLDEISGVRGYKKYFRTGNRLAVINYENRIYPDWEILTVTVGLVQFIDIGQLWSDYVDYSKKLCWSAGLGLRFGLEKFANSQVFSVDLAYTGEFNDWELSFGLNRYIF